MVVSLPRTAIRIRELPNANSVFCAIRRPGKERVPSQPLATIRVDSSQAPCGDVPIHERGSSCQAIYLHLFRYSLMLTWMLV